MTVKQLITKLLDCRMDASVSVLVELRRDYIDEQLEEFSDYTYPISEDAEIEDMTDGGNSVRIYLNVGDSD